MQIQLSKDEYKDIVSYCQLNNLNIDDVIRKSFLEGFRIEKYGLLNLKDRIVEKEIIKEVPVEKIVEVIKEVPRIEYVNVIKEVPVTEYVEVIKEVIKEIPSEPEKIEIIKYIDREVIKEVIVEKPVVNIDNFYDKNYLEELENKIKILESKNPEIKEIEKVVEVIKEVPIEIIKEIPVEVIKEVYIEKNNEDLKSKIEALQKTLMKIREENIDKDKIIVKLKEELNNKINNEVKPAVFLKGSNLNTKI